MEGSEDAPDAMPGTNAGDHARPVVGSGCPSLRVIARPAVVLLHVLKGK
jgi:hypothetical protein